MVDPTTCSRCDSTATKTILTPDGPHYAKLMCGGCDRFIKWLPTPTSTVMPTVYRRPGQPPAMLNGTPPQVAAAESIRSTMLRLCSGDGRPDIAAVVASVTAASWFLANRDRRIDALKWPSESQMEAAVTVA